MYSELLATTLRSEEHLEHGWEGPGAMLARLLVCRRNLARSPAPPSGGQPTEDIAVNVAYDLSLLRVCRALGIESAPSCFDRPLVERARLEGRLHEHGVDLDDFDPS